MNSPPDSYVCKLCHVEGEHWVTNCPLNTYKKLKQQLGDHPINNLTKGDVKRMAKRQAVNSFKKGQKENRSLETQRNDVEIEIENQKIDDQESQHIKTFEDDDIVQENHQSILENIENQNFIDGVEKVIPNESNEIDEINENKEMDQDDEPIQIQENEIKREKFQKIRRKRASERSQHGTKIVFDLSYGDYMLEGEIKSLKNQIKECYSRNIRSKKPFRLVLTSFEGKIEKELSGIGGFDIWDIDKYADHYSNVFGYEEIISLSPDSQNILEKISNDKVYIIGALVDRKGIIGLSLEKANEHGVETAKLPLGNYVYLSRNNRLPVHHVFSIMKSVDEGKTWENAITTSVPKMRPKKIDVL